MPLSEFPLPPEESSGNEPPLVRVTPPGPMSKSAAARLAKVESPAFERRRADRAASSGAAMDPVVLQSGKGSNLYDVDGNRYVDLAAGFGSVLLGHGATAVTRALEGQSERLVQALGDVYSADAKIALLERLAALLPGGSRVLLGQSGSDAVTVAIKTAMLATGKPGLVAFEGAYHGLGYAPLPACGLAESLRAPFAAQLNGHVTFAPYPRRSADLDRSVAAVDAALGRGDVGAVLVEPILGRGGCVVPPDGFLAALCESAHRHGALVVADEIWTGLGRSGAMLRSVELGAPVDLVCVGKGLGGGLPISACIGRDSVMGAWASRPGVLHTSTHAGLPLACAVAIATLDTVRFRHLAARATELGDKARALLDAALSGRDGVVEVRGAGLLVGVELDDGARAQRAVRGLLERGYIAVGGGVRGELVTWTPPLTIAEELLAGAADALAAAL